MQVLNSKIAYAGRFLKIRVDTVELAPGKPFDMEVVAHSGAVAMLPVDADGQIYFIRQYRHATGGNLFEIPAGTLGTGEDPVACANRELQEEIGMRADHFDLLTGFYLAPGYSTEYLRVYVATGLQPSHLPGDEDEAIEVVRTSLADALAMLQRGEIRDTKTQVALLWYAQRQTGGVAAA